MIDWERPLRFVGTTTHAKVHGPALGGDVWIAADFGLTKFTSRGTHIQYPHEPLLPNIENWPMDELQRFAAQRIREARAQRRMGEALENVPGFATF